MHNEWSQRGPSAIAELLVLFCLPQFCPRLLGEKQTVIPAARITHKRRNSIYPLKADIVLRKSKVKVKCTDIAVRSLTCHTVTGTHMPYGITQCYLPPDRGDIPAFTGPSRSWYSITRPRRDARLS